MIMIYYICMDIFRGKYFDNLLFDSVQVVSLVVIFECLFEEKDEFSLM